MERIESKDNKTLTLFRKLTDKKYRMKEKKFIVEGFRFVKEALNSDFDIAAVLISESAIAKWESFIKDNDIASNIKVYELSEKLFNSIALTDTPQGIAAIVSMKKEYMHFKDGLYILVDGVQDPGNLGSIIRTADAAGASGVILNKGTVDLYNPKTLRSSMGSIFHIPIIECENLNFVLELKKAGFRILASSLEESENFYLQNLKSNVVIAVGNEGAGISQEVYSISDVKVKLPMLGKAESLNVSTATSIMVFEALRQKMFDKN